MTILRATINQCLKNLSKTIRGLINPQYPKINNIISSNNSITSCQFNILPAQTSTSEKSSEELTTKVNYDEIPGTNT